MIEEIFEKTTFTDVFLIIIASICIVAFWRGMWGLMDLFIFDEDPLVSMIVSIIIGVIILLLIAMHRTKK